MKLPFYVNEALKAYFEVASADRRALLDTELFNTDPLTCKKEYLPLLAAEAGVDIDGFSESEQRELIANAFKSFNRTGTVGALKGALSVIAPMELQEQKNFIFSVKMPYLQNGVYSKERFATIFKTIKKSKNVRSNFNSLKLNTKAFSKIDSCSAIGLDIDINKNLEVNWVYEDSKNFTSAISLDVNLAKDLELSFTSNINQIGAVLWQV